MTTALPRSVLKHRSGSAGRGRRGFVAALAVGVLALAAATPARASFTFAQFAEGSGNAFSYNTTTGLLSGSDAGLFTFLNFPGQPTTPQAVTITLTGSSTGPAVSGLGASSQPFSGVLAFTQGANNLLTATFTGSLTGLTGSGTATFNIAVPPDTLALTSTVINTALIQQPGLQISFNNIIETGGGSGPSINDATGNLNSFTTNLTGQFTASAVPEPGSVVLFGIGLSTAAVVAARRKGRVLNA